MPAVIRRSQCRRSMPETPVDSVGRPPGLHGGVVPLAEELKEAQERRHPRDLRPEGEGAHKWHWHSGGDVV